MRRVSTKRDIIRRLTYSPICLSSIIAVHGLGASPDWAWIRKVENGNEEANVNWLADEHMLPAKLPDSRIMTFNYESKWFLEAPKQRRSLCAIQLLTALDNRRTQVTTPLSQRSTIMTLSTFFWQEKDTKHRPLIFIGHSFGGVVIEQVRRRHLVPSQA